MRLFCVFILLAELATAAPLEEWKPYEKTGLFSSGNSLWLTPDMEREPIAAFTARLLDEARESEPKAMATLGRFFYVRRDRERAIEWLTKAARAGHAGAQFDFGVMRLNGIGEKADSIEAYAWLWLATRGGAPGAEEALRHLMAKLSMGEVIGGTQLAVALEVGMGRP